MSEIRRFPILRHLRSEPSTHLLVYRNGEIRRSGPGLNLWFLPMSTGIAEIPIDDREMQFVFHGRSADFQDVTIQGVITYRVTDPITLASRVDFTIDLATGAYSKQPIQQLELLISQLAQQFAWDYLSVTPIRESLTHGPDRIRHRITDGVHADSGFDDMGLALVSVRIAAVQPTADLERALEAPMREKIQQEADLAGFERRAAAVENERAIQENELKNKIELARQEETLIAQIGQNTRHQAREEAEADRVRAESLAAQSRIEADADATQIRVRAGGNAEGSRLAGEAEAQNLRLLEETQVAAEKERMATYRDLPPHVLFGLAARELAKKLERIDHLNLAPEILSPLIASLVQAGTDHLAETRAQ
ncbi:MAG: SPFH domain-containing protein [Acidobacteriota bacterium]|nr:SPFH domain-containing protein [Acidobacteriota bacterium]